MNFCRLAQKSDYESIVNLWEIVFEDSAEFITEGINIFAGMENMYVCVCENKKVLAMLSAVPCTLGSCHGVYLYALATSPAARKEGVMTQLMCYAQQAAIMRQNAEFAVLIPASSSLFDYYKKRGYKQTVFLQHIVIKKSQVPAFFCSMPQIIKPNGLEFEALRRKHITVPFVEFSTPRSEVLLKDIYATGGQICATSQGYAVCFAKGDTLHISELFAETEEMAMQIINWLFCQTECRHAQLTLANGSDLFSAIAHERKKKPFALLKPLNDTFSVKQPYLRFGFEELFQ